MIVKFMKVKVKNIHLQKKNRPIAYALIKSSSTPDKYYDVVKYNNKTYGCGCMDRLFRKGKRCKHIKEFIAYENK